MQVGFKRFTILGKAHFFNSILLNKGVYTFAGNYLFESQSKLLIYHFQPILSTKEPSHNLSKVRFMILQNRGNGSTKIKQLPMLRQIKLLLRSRVLTLVSFLSSMSGRVIVLMSGNHFLILILMEKNHKVQANPKKPQKQKVNLPKSLLKRSLSHKKVNQYPNPQNSLSLSLRPKQ